MVTPRVVLERYEVPIWSIKTPGRVLKGHLDQYPVNINIAAIGKACFNNLVSNDTLFPLLLD